MRGFRFRPFQRGFHARVWRASVRAAMPGLSRNVFVPALTIGVGTLIGSGLLALVIVLFRAIMR